MKKHVSMIAVGDLAPLRSLSGDNSAVEQVWTLFRDADLVMANLELPLTSSQERADKAITLKSDPAVAASLSECGIDVVTVANNHALDFGSSGLLETLTVLERQGIRAVGGGENVDAAMRCEVLNVDDVKVAVMGMASTLPTGYAAGETRPGIAPVRVRSRFYIDNITLDEQPGISPWVETSVVEADQVLACEKIAAAKKLADIVIVHMHWGIPNGWCAAFQGPLADYQRPLGHAFIDAGADVIIGSHPHIIHGVERYKNGVIVYSAGNFLFHSMGNHHEMKLQAPYPPYKLESLEQGDARDGLVVHIGATDKRVTELQLRPVRMNSEGDPEFLHGTDAARALDRVQRLSKELDTDVAIDGECATITVG